MQIVIDIPEEDYKTIIQRPKQCVVHWDIVDALRNGTPLPKGHGRLIDADKYRRMWVDTFDSCYGDACSKLFKDSVDNADTIIEADKGDKE